MVHTLRVIPHCCTILAIFYTKVAEYYIVEIMLRDFSSEGDFVGAEPHLLASGTRDSARLLAQVYFGWAKASNSLGSHAGIFALRGTLPYAIHLRTRFNASLCVGICSTAIFSLHVPSLRVLYPQSLHLESPFLLAPPVTRSWLPTTPC